MSPSGPGFLAFRHRGFDTDSPAWDLDKRLILAGGEFTGRDDNQSPSSIGHLKEDPNTRGDLNCANYWQSDYSKRPVGCWAFGYASIINGETGTPTGPPGTIASPGNGVATTTGQGGGGATPGNISVSPVGMNAQIDSRFNPKTPLIMQPEGSADGDPNSPGVNGPGGAPGAGGQAGGGGQSGAPGDNSAATNLGNGWQYQDGALAYFGPTAQTTDSLSGYNGGYFGGSFGVSFSGVGSYFGGSLGVKLTYPK